MCEGQMYADMPNYPSEIVLENEPAFRLKNDEKKVIFSRLKGLFSVNLPTLFITPIFS